jgi:hypothetical protein
MEKSKRTIPDRVSKGDVPVPGRLRLLDSKQLHAVLATDMDGQPYTSLVAYALIPDMKGIVFTTPKSTQKYKNILRNRRVSLLIDTRLNNRKDYMGAESLTILGNAGPMKKKSKQWLTYSEIFVKKHPHLKEIIHSSETALMLVKIIRCIHVTRFQSVSVWNKD